MPLCLCSIDGSTPQFDKSGPQQVLLHMAYGSRVLHGSTTFMLSHLPKLIWQVNLLCCCREACELRSILARAAEALQQLEGAVRTLQRSGKEADAEGVQEAILQVGWPSQPAGRMTAGACMHGKSSHRERALPWVLPSSVGHNEATEMFR